VISQPPNFLPKKVKNTNPRKKPVKRPMPAIPNEGTNKQKKRKILELEEDIPLNSELKDNEEEEVSPLINKYKKAGNPKKNSRTPAHRFKQNLASRFKKSET